MLRGMHAQNTYDFDNEVVCYIKLKNGNQARKRKAGAPAILG
jgi:dTDP-4-dehydrorhamnose 3,5-epimerase-like enzyme